MKKKNVLAVAIVVPSVIVMLIVTAVPIVTAKNNIYKNKVLRTLFFYYQRKPKK